MRVHLLALLAVPIYAQTVSVGVKVGVPFNDPTGAYGESRPYTFGPTVEVRLPAGFAVEGSALYRRLGRTTTYSYLSGENLLTSDALTSYNNRARGNAWDFSLLPKYYFGNRHARWQPFLGTGWTLRTVSGTMKGSSTVSGPSGTTTTPFDVHGRSPLAVGATVAAGVRIRTGRISWVPELRYTRWGRQESPYGPNPRNEGGFYLGIRF